MGQEKCKSLYFRINKFNIKAKRIIAWLFNVFLEGKKADVSKLIYMDNQFGRNGDE